MRRILGTTLLGLSASVLMFAQVPAYTIKTYAGSIPALSGPANSIIFQSISAILPDPQGNIYVADPNGRKVVKIDTSGQATLVIGTNNNNIVAPTKNGVAANQSAIHAPAGLALDSLGNLYVS